MTNVYELPLDVNDLRKHGYGDSQLPSLVKGMRYLCAVGFALEDVADAMYMSVQVLPALVALDYRRALDFVALTLEQNLRLIKKTGLSESKLWILTEVGLAVGEIAWAIKHVDRFYNNIVCADLSEIQLIGKSVYETLRKSRLTRRTSRTTRRSDGIARAHSVTVHPESWFDHYSQVIQMAIERRPEGPLPEPSIFSYLGGYDFSILDLYFIRAKRREEIGESGADGDLNDEDQWDAELDDDEDVWLSK